MIKIALTSTLCLLLSSCAVVLGTADAVYSVTSATISAGASVGGAVIDVVSGGDEDSKKK